MPSVPGFNRPTLSTLIDRIEGDLNSRLPGADSRLRRSVLNVLAFTLAGTAHLLYGFASYIAAQILPDTAVTQFLDRHSGIWNIPRKAAAKATGNVTFTGTNGTVIPASTLIQRVDGRQFTTDAEATIAGGTALVAVTSVLAGAGAETAAATVLTLASPITGVASNVTVDASGLTGAADAETDAALRARILDRIQKPPAGGDAQDYVTWALQVAGVTRAWCFPLELGVGTVTVRFVRDNDASIIPDAGEVQAVADYIDPLRPVTADVTVVAPTEASQDFTIAVNPDTSAIRAAIQAQLEDFIRREAIPGATLYISRIREAISAAEGEFSHVLTAPSSDVVLTDSQVGTMGTITWS